MLSVAELDQLFIDSCELVAPAPSKEEISSRISASFPRLSGLRRVLPTGSRLHSTAITANSGIDVFLVGGWAISETPLAVLDMIETATAGWQTARWGRRVSALDETGERFCLIPMISPTDSTDYIPDETGTRWIRAISDVHSKRILAMSPVQKCAIRVFKTWNVDEQCKINAFAVEAVAIEAFAPRYAVHIHVCLKELFDRLRGVRQFLRHPLNPDVPVVSQNNDDIAGLDEKLRSAAETSHNAWFLTEMGDVDSAVVRYAKLLDPDTFGPA